MACADMSPIDFIYHEKQDGLLCAQHCLNNLLQGQYFTAVDLAEIAQQMDQAEQQHMAELGMHTDDFRRFIEQPSINMDDSGMFSVQVLSSALRVWDLSLVPYTSSHNLAQAARSNPTEQKAYICNFKEHWLTVRKLGCQWFNLNSLLTCPEAISNTYLSLFLTQLQHEGYSVFVVEGSLPSSEADETLKLQPVIQRERPRLLSDDYGGGNASSTESDLKAALEASLATVSAGKPSSSAGTYHSDADDLQAALIMSLQDCDSKDTKHSPEQNKPASSHTNKNSPKSSAHTSEEDQLAAALKMSLEQSLVDGSLENSTEDNGQKPTEDSGSDGKADLDELREKRLAYLAKKKP